MLINNKTFVMTLLILRSFDPVCFRIDALTKDLGLHILFRYIIIFVPVLPIKILFFLLNIVYNKKIRVHEIL